MSTLLQMAVPGNKHLVKFLSCKKFLKKLTLTFFCALFLFTLLKEIFYADKRVLSSGCKTCLERVYRYYRFNEKDKQLFFS